MEQKTLSLIIAIVVVSIIVYMLYAKNLKDKAASQQPSSMIVAPDGSWKPDLQMGLISSGATLRTQQGQRTDFGERNLNNEPELESLWRGELRSGKEGLTGKRINLPANL